MVRRMARTIHPSVPGEAGYPREGRWKQGISTPNEVFAVTVLATSVRTRLLLILVVPLDARARQLYPLIRRIFDTRLYLCYC